MSGGHYTTVVLPIKGGGSKVYELDPCVPHSSYGSLGEGAVLAVPVTRHEQDVLGLQVSVGKVVVVKELDSIAELVGDMSDLIQRVSNISISFQEVKHGFPQDFKS